MTFPVSFYHHQANDPSVNFDEAENRAEALEEESPDVKTWVAGVGSPCEICTDHVRDPGRNLCHGSANTGDPGRRRSAKNSGRLGHRSGRTARCGGPYPSPILASPVHGAPRGP